MTSQHTPGPWRFSDRDWKNQKDAYGNLYVTGDHRAWFSDGARQDSGEACVAVAQIMGNPTAGGIPLANARLIAAAPDLLAACKQALDDCRHEPGLCALMAATVAQLTDVVAKAEG